MTIKDSKVSALMIANPRNALPVPRFSSSRLFYDSSPRNNNNRLNSRTNQLMMDQRKKNQEITRQWEAEIQASSKEKSDLQRVQQWLAEDSPSDVYYDNGWKVALASGVVCGLGCEWITESTMLSVATFGAAFWVALRDPLEEEDNLAGPLARIIGRSALQSYQQSQPKLKAVARAAVQGEEAWTKLQEELAELRKENQQLRLFVERREWIDEHQSNFNLEELKVLAQRSGIPYSGITKTQLMMRLLQVGGLRMKQ